MTNPFAKPAAKVTTPQNLERSQSLANALNSSGGMSKKSVRMLSLPPFEENVSQQKEIDATFLFMPFPVVTKEDENAAKKSKKVVFEENAATEEKSTKVKAEQKKSKGAYLLWIKENRKVRSPCAASFRSGGHHPALITALLRISPVELHPSAGHHEGQPWLETERSRKES